MVENGTAREPAGRPLEGFAVARPPMPATRALPLQRLRTRLLGLLRVGR